MLTADEKKLRNALYQKKYREKNKEFVVKYRREWDNKNYEKEYWRKKKWASENPKYLKFYKKMYYEVPENKDRLAL